MTSPTFERDPLAPPLKRWRVEKPDGQYRRSLLELPSGDYVNPRLIDMVRVSAAKADRATGEIGAAVHVECKGSWYSQRFEDLDEAKSFARALVDYRDETLN